MHSWAQPGRLTPIVHWRARGQQTWETRTILVPPVDRPTTEKVSVTEVNPKVEKVMTVKSCMLVYLYLYTLETIQLQPQICGRWS